MKATHNGHCQVCGRLQAAKPIVWRRAGLTQPVVTRIAKHGYRVTWGYFNGTCGGSDEMPVELGKGVATETIIALTGKAKTLAAKTPDDITKVQVSVYDRAIGDFIPTYANAGEIALANFFDPKLRFMPYVWEERVERQVRQCHFEARQMAAHCEFLRKLIVEFHGKPLVPR